MIEVGQVIGNWRVDRMLGQGGMGAVFEAVHQEMGKRAAIKVLHPQFSQNPEIGTRFLNEARAASAIEHLGVVDIFEFSRLPDGTTYIVMEFLRGQSLTRRIEEAQGPLGPDALRLTRQIGSVLAAAHEKGIVHRDLKPDNVMIVPDSEAPGGERAKVLDFGIAKVADEYQKPGSEHVKTHAGMLLGTPAYMSPEQCRGAVEVDAKADVYSLGVMMYQMLTGKLPFAAKGLGELMAMHMFNQPAALREVEPSVSPPLEALVNSMMAKNPAERPAMTQVVKDLEHLGAARTGVLHLPVPEPPSHNTPKGPQGPKGTVVLTENGPVLPPTLHQDSQPPGPQNTPQPVVPGSTGYGKVIAVAIAAGVICGVTAGAVLLGKRHQRTIRTEQDGKRRPPDSGKHLVTTGETEGKDRPRERPPEPKKTRPAPEGMAYLATATYEMGSKAEDLKDAQDLCAHTGGACKREFFEREQPARSVTVSEFFLDTTEVTNERFAAWLTQQRGLKVDRKGRFVKDGSDLLVDLHPANSGLAFHHGHQGFSARSGFESKPVVQVTWTAAQRYCESQGKRLPTEAEWERAARSAGGRFPWGNQVPTCGEVVFGRAAGQPCAGGGSGPAGVGTSARDRTPEGVLDLGGNVSEWVLDRFVAPYPRCQSGCTDPVVNEDSQGGPVLRVIRGGDWGQFADSCRAAGRSRSAPDQVQINVGFRCGKPYKQERNGG